MSETLPNGGAGNDDWNSLANDENIEKIDEVEQGLEDGENPNDVLRKAYEDGLLTRDFIDQHEASLLESGLTQDQLDKYRALASEADTAENRRRRFDEEPEVEGFEGDDAQAV